MWLSDLECNRSNINLIASEMAAVSPLRRDEALLQTHAGILRMHQSDQSRASPGPGLASISTKCHMMIYGIASVACRCR
jgi:hypothetical protein